MSGEKNRPVVPQSAPVCLLMSCHLHKKLPVPESVIGGTVFQQREVHSLPQVLRVQIWGPEFPEQSSASFELQEECEYNRSVSYGPE